MTAERARRVELVAGVGPDGARPSPVGAEEGGRRTGEGRRVKNIFARS